MTTTDRQPPHHRNLTCYTDYRCRLPECVERKNAWARETRRKKREGQPRLVDAAPVRQHILALTAGGATTCRIALHAGVSEAAIRAFLPSKTGCRSRKNATAPETAQKILAVTADGLTSGYVDGTGTRRRIQALAAKGWPLLSLGKRLGLHPHYVGDLIRRTEKDRPIYTATAEQVADAYEQLKARKLPRQGVDPRASKRIRERAAEMRWPTPSYWDQHADDIDDPHFQPLYGVTRREIVAQDANWIIRTTGISKTEAAARLGVDKSYVDHAFRDHPEYAIEVAA